jgi:cyanophycinase-like exopeptidase
MERIMRKLYLFGDLAENFEILVNPFIRQSGGEKAKIVLLIAGGKDWEKYIENYTIPMKNNGANNISVIVPEKDGSTISENNLRKLKESTGIFIGGGNTANYQNIYCNKKIADILNVKYKNKIPYAGLSAVAIITATSFFKYETLNSNLNGLKILKDSFIVPHFIESNGFKAIIQGFNKTENKFGIGINNFNCVEITNEKECKITGSSNCYLFTKESKNINLEEFGNGDKFIL